MRTAGGGSGKRLTGVENPSVTRRISSSAENKTGSWESAVI